MYLRFYKRPYYNGSAHAVIRIYTYNDKTSRERANKPRPARIYGCFAARPSLLLPKQPLPAGFSEYHDELASVFSRRGTVRGSGHRRRNTPLVVMTGDFVKGISPDGRAYRPVARRHLSFTRSRAKVNTRCRRYEGEAEGVRERARDRSPGKSH